MIEADFQREYGMDLIEQLDQGLSWRRFLVLLGHFGPDSVTVFSLSSPSEDVIKDEKQADEFIKGW